MYVFLCQISYYFINRQLLFHFLFRWSWIYSIKSLRPDVRVTVCLVEFSHSSIWVELPSTSWSLSLSGTDLQLCSSLFDCTVVDLATFSSFSVPSFSTEPILKTPLRHRCTELKANLPKCFNKCRRRWPLRVRLHFVFHYRGQPCTLRKWLWSLMELFLYWIAFVDQILESLLGQLGQLQFSGIVWQTFLWCQHTLF